MVGWAGEVVVGVKEVWQRLVLTTKRKKKHKRQENSKKLIISEWPDGGGSVGSV